MKKRFLIAEIECDILCISRSYGCEGGGVMSKKYDITKAEVATS